MEAFYQKIIAKEAIKALELASLLGILRWSTFIITEGNIFLNSLQEKLTSSGANKLWSQKPKPKIKPNPVIVDPQEMTDDLKWWIEVLQEQPKLKIHHIQNFSFLHQASDVDFALEVV